jgi:hypothetical protein
MAMHGNLSWPTAKRLRVVRAATDLQAHAHIYRPAKARGQQTAMAGACFLALVATPFLPLFQEKAYAHAALGTKQHTPACIPCMFVKPAAAEIGRKCIRQQIGISERMEDRFGKGQDDSDGHPLQRVFASEGT